MTFGFRGSPVPPTSLWGNQEGNLLELGTSSVKPWYPNPFLISTPTYWSLGYLYSIIHTLSYSVC
ncbi:rCG20919 [Rattus norvegicus]|uniref:RCG20919 n=1 Tax=Rattus norvegicus TaxID=10116 RepID=A6JDT6_RAT|nr:rCG20919 [Rattus norvegicus]